MLLVSQTVLYINLVILMMIVLIMLLCCALVDEVDLSVYFSKNYRFWICVLITIFTNYFFLFMDYLITSYLK